LPPQTFAFPVIHSPKRVDAAPLHENPVRRFREDLRLNRAQFSRVIGIQVDTIRSWEMTGSRNVLPRRASMTLLLKLARRNKYPLNYGMLYEYSSKQAQRVY